MIIQYILQLKLILHVYVNYSLNLYKNLDFLCFVPIAHPKKKERKKVHSSGQYLTLAEWRFRFYKMILDVKLAMPI